MPTVATFRNIHDTDQAVTVPNGAASDYHIENIEFPGVDPAAKSVLFMRIDPQSTPVTLSVSINGTHVLLNSNGNPGITFNMSTERSWHERVGPNILMETGNTIVLDTTGSPVGASIEIADIVMMYKTNV
jgi:hypothetical protein